MNILADKRILVLEDEFLVALDLEDCIRDLGAHVVGPASKVSQAKQLIEAGGIDAAVLDVNINGEPSHDVARLLSDRLVPFIFTTGYGDELGFDGAIVLRKPYSAAQIRTALETALG